LEARADVHRLDPGPPTLPTLGRDDDEAREALWVPRLEETAKPLAGPRWWSDGHFATWLAGGSVLAQPPGGSIAPTRRLQVHVGIRAEEQTAEEGVLFSHDVVETLDRDAEWAIGLEVVLPDGAGPAVATLGSDGRIARIEPLPEQVFDPPDAVLGAFRAGSAGLRLVVVSPACFDRGWLPDGFDRRGREFRGRVGALDAELVLRAAMVPRPLHVSGWDMAAGAPKPTSRIVRPGAVYFFERADGRPFGEADAGALWLAAVGARIDEGFGRVVPGSWSPTRSRR
jgi:CRISPR-associated protein Cmr3